MTSASTERPPNATSALHRPRLVEVGQQWPWLDPACEVEPWDRLPKEATGAFAYFVAYRDQPPGRRSLRKAAKQVGRSMRQITTIQSRWFWQERVRLWDAHVDHERQSATIEEAREMARRHANLAKEVLDLVTRRVLGDEVTEAIDANKLNAGDIARLLEVAIRAERMSRGEPTEIATVSTTATTDRTAASARLRELLADPDLLDAAEKLGAAMAEGAPGET